MTFSALRLAEPILRAVAAEGYTVPTPIQIQAIPEVLAGRDLFGCAQTGTGKTAAFALPILHRLGHAPHTSARKIRALVLSPTRELAAQIGDSFRAYGRHTGLRHAVIFGGVGQHAQVQALRAGVDILVATPGRLMDLMDQGFVRLDAVEIFVLDEADRMLDMGFIHDIRRVAAKLPTQRQTLLFSATMPPEIRRLASTLMKDKDVVEVKAAPPATTVQAVQQFVFHVDKGSKPALLRRLLQEDAMARTLVFTRTKHGADKVVKFLRGAGVAAEAIHGNKAQNARTRALASFKSARPPVLVATDIASRGIDIDEISHVVNYDMPVSPETYVHRIGRTARAGAAGVAFSFCDGEERERLRDIERLIRQAIPVRGDGPRGGQAPAHARPHVAAHAHASRPAHTPHAPHAPQRHSPRPAPATAAAGHSTGGHRAAPPQPGRGRGPAPKRRRVAMGKGGHRRF